MISCTHTHTHTHIYIYIYSLVNNNQNNNIYHPRTIFWIWVAALCSRIIEKRFLATNALDANHVKKQQQHIHYK